VPVLVFLKHGISNVFEQRRDSLESLLKNVIWRGGRQGKILLLLDGLDEYRQDLNYLINDLIGTKFGDYREMKIIVTTRLNAGFPDILGIREGKYLRLLPLTKEQVNLFFKNLGLDLDYDKALTLGLKEQDITKPLLALLFSEVFSEDNPHLSVIKDPKTHTSNNLSKALIYFYFIRRIFQGSIANGKEKHSVVKEKVILRKIALMKQVYKQDLTDKKLEKVQEAFGIIIDSSQIQKLFNPIIESYFFTGSEEEAIDFVHEYFKEYLLAENYLEVLLKGETPSWMNAGLPSEATIDFLEGLIEILKSERESIKAIVNPDTTSMVGLLDSFEINESKEVVLRKLMENAMGNVNNENTYVFTSTLEKGPWIQ
jgi:hypothetical protein